MRALAALAHEALAPAPATAALDIIHLGGLQAGALVRLPGRLLAAAVGAVVVQGRECG